MITTVETKALLAILYEDDHTDRSDGALRQAYQAGKVVTTPIVSAELAADGHFDTHGAVDAFLEDFSIKLVEPSRSALFVAGERFHRSVDRRPSGLQCPDCGTRQSVSCTNGGTALGPRQHRFLTALGVGVAGAFFGPIVVTAVPPFAFAGLGLVVAVVLWVGFAKGIAKCSVST